MRVLDGGCGRGALSAVLTDRLGTANVAAADPSAQFVEACRTRLPGVDVAKYLDCESPAEADRLEAVARAP